MSKKRKLKTVIQPKQEQGSKPLIASNALLDAMNFADWGYNFNDSLNPVMPYNNISLDPLTLQPYLLTFLYKTYGILGKIIDIPVDDAFKQGGYDLETDNLTEDELNELIRAKNKDNKKIKTAAKWARLFGGSALIAISGDKLSTPVTPQNLYNSDLQFMPVNRWQLQYSKPNINIPGGVWALTSDSQNPNAAITDIHSSRVCILKGKEAPFLIEQLTGGWGISIFEQIFQEMNQLFKANNVIFELLDEAKVDILKLATLQTAFTSGAGERQLRRMVDSLARSKNYKGLLTVSKEDEYDQKQINFGGLEGILKEIRIMMAGAANMPVNKLWGEGVTGFGSGEDSLENYNSQIENEIREPHDDAIEWVLKLRCYQLFGQEVDDLIKDWKNLRVLSAIDEQNIADHKVTNALQLYDRQLLTPQELMQYLKKQQIFIHKTKAFDGELEDMPLINQDNKFTEIKDISKE